MTQGTLVTQPGTSAQPHPPQSVLRGTHSMIHEATLVGASPDTGNRGVTALCHSVIWHLHQSGVDRINVFDHGRGERATTVAFGNEDIPICQLGAVLSRRYYRSENLWNMRVTNWAGGLLNPAVRAIRRSQVVLDVSAGDSFTDLYGARRFQAIMLPKQIAREAGRPLVLLPQTYGPFQHTETKNAAREVVCSARQAWARDADSFAALRELAGSDFDPARHRQGVDLAFALPAFAPANIPPELARWLTPSESPRETVLGFNVSGLIYNQPEVARDQFGLKTDYKEVVRRFLEWILLRTDMRVVLVSHVIAPTGNPENDFDAVRAILDWVPAQWRSRVLAAPTGWSPSELKWLIGQTAWFCGTRMHSTIAALGTATPAAALAYSLKTRGVFGSCGQADQVLELRQQSTDEVLAGLQSSFQRRQATRASLSQSIGAVRDRARTQLDEILASVSAGEHERGPIHGG